MILLENAGCADAISIVEAILSEAPDAKRRLLDKFGPGLNCLIGRHCWERAEQFYAAVADATIDAVRSEETSTDEDLPRLIRAIFRRLLPAYKEDLSAYRARVFDEIARIHPKVISEISQELRQFNLIQLRALIRLYKHRDSIPTICSSLGLSRDEFDEIRKAALQISRRTFEGLGAPRRLPSRTFSTELKTRGVAG